MCESPFSEGLRQSVRKMHFRLTVSFLCFNSGDAGAYFAYYQSDCKYTKIFYSWYYRLKKSFCQQKKRLEKPFL